MPEMIDGVKTTGSGSDTWQYKILNQNFDKIIEKLADFKLARKVADKLAAREVIGKSVRDEADVTGPGVTESLRVRPIITALQSKVETDARVYHQFLEILQSDDIAVDAEAALYYLPKSEADALSVLKECLPQPQKAVHILTGTIITPAAPHDLVEEEWYHGHISYIEAEKRLKASPDGYFLVRESASSPGNYILNMKHNGEITHFLVEFRKDPHTFEVEGSRRSFGQLQDLIQHYTQHPITAKQEKLLGACPNPNSRGPFVNLSDRLRLWF